MKASETVRRTYARIAGFTFLFYIVSGLTSLSLGNQSQFADLLYLFQNVSALVLGVTLYMVTREYGPALALLALTFRIMEAVHSESEIFFAAGSLLYCLLLLRGRIIPVPLAQLGVIASALLVVILPLQLAGLFGGSMSWSASVTWMIWLPMLVFEVTAALWLMIKGVKVEQAAIAESI